MGWRCGGPAVRLARDPDEPSTLFLSAADFNAAGRITEEGNPHAAATPLLAEFVYDAFGRLMQTTRYDPFGNNQVEDYYYDGVRRIQEVESRGGGRCDDRPALQKWSG